MLTTFVVEFHLEFTPTQAAEIEAIVPSIPPVRRDVVVSSLRRYRIGSLLDRGDLVGARRELDAYDVSDGDAWLRETTARGAILLSIRCDLAAGNVEGALSTTQGPAMSSRRCA